jgi:predicted RNA-binding protein (virulence factor B family)
VGPRLRTGPAISAYSRAVSPSPLGTTVSLPIRHFGPPGAFLALDPSEDSNADSSLLLPKAEVPDGAKAGDELSVFIYLDSEDRWIATRRAPKLELGEVAFLTVTDRTRFGSFVDWGLPKELLVPFAEQTRDLGIGERHPIGLYVDSSGRLAGTMRVSEMLVPARGEYEQDLWLDGEAWRRDPEVGLFVILERSTVGVVPASEPHALERGEAARFRITNVLPDGKLELSLRGRAHEELEADAQKIFDALTRARAPRVGDQSSPQEIRAAFGLSKKAFKRAVGRLLKQGRVRQDADGFLVLAR